MTMDRIMSGVGQFDDGFDDEFFLDQDGGEEVDWPQPEWLHSGCLNVGFALEVGRAARSRTTAWSASRWTWPTLLTWR